jgi:diacylglycerol kinase (ATP)
MASPKKRGLTRLYKAFWYSVAGLKAAWKNEEAFRIESICAAILIPAGLLLGTTATQRALLISTYLLVLIVELINSAIEAAIDRMGSERHVLSGRAKDLGSASVLLCICVTVLVWGLIAFERICK